MALFGKIETVADLKKALEDYPDDMRVRFVYPSGDYWRTELARQVKDLEEGMISHSDYHNMDRVDSYQDSDDEEPEDYDPVLLIK